MTPAPLLLASVGSKNSISLFGEKRIKMITRWWQAGRTTVKLLINITDNRWAGGWWLAGYPRHLLLSKIITQNILTPRPLLLLSPPHLWRSPGVLLWIKPNTIWSSWQGKHARQYLISRLHRAGCSRPRVGIETQWRQPSSLIGLKTKESYESLGSPKSLGYEEGNWSYKPKLLCH